MTSPKVHIVVLNWNGWLDTVECLESLFRSAYADFCVILVDNGSEDDSVSRIQEWARGEYPVLPRHVVDDGLRWPVRVVKGDIGRPNGSALRPADLVLIEAGENLGFAGGSNVGIRYALATGAEYVFLLNNDTVLETSAIGELVGFLETNPDVVGVTGQIRLYDEPRVIWNCGGDLTRYGGRRYHHAGRSVERVPQQGSRAISFVTGCAVLFRASLFRDIGVLTERFFFGEEDFELALRLKRSRHRLACCYCAVIYHKVSQAIRRVTDGEVLKSAYLYYLNRFIDMRLYWPRGYWRVWRSLYFVYIGVLLKTKHGASWESLSRFRKALFRDSENLDGVDRAMFKRVMGQGFVDGHG